MREESAKRSLSGTRAERHVAPLAARQHGVVSTSQLHGAGITRSGITRRVQAGRLHRVHRGVYAVGHARLSFEGRCAAAVLACGPGAAVSHLTAAVLWGMLSFDAGLIEITTSTGNGKKTRRGVRVHRSTLSGETVTRRQGIPVTRPLRTLDDLHRTAPKLHQPALRRALDLRLVAEEDLGPDPDLTRSDLERLFRRLCRRRRLPEPEVNARVEGFEVDFFWRGMKVVVEADSFRYRRDREAFERDRARDAKLHALGHRVVRLTHRQLTEDPQAAFASVAALLGSATPSP